MEENIQQSVDTQPIPVPVTQPRNTSLSMTIDQYIAFGSLINEELKNNVISQQDKRYLHLALMTVHETLAGIAFPNGIDYQRPQQQPPQGYPGTPASVGRQNPQITRR